MNAAVPGPVASSTRGAVPRWVPPLLLGGMVGALVAGRFATALLCVATVSVAAAAARAPRPSRGWAVTLGTGIAIALALNLYLTPGRPLGLPVLFGLHATGEGLRYGALLGLRLIGAMVALHGLSAAWPGERGADELARLAAPLERVRVPVREARAVIGLALRFAPLLVAEARRISALQELRAGRPARGAWEWLMRRRAAAIPTLVCALERAERVALALEARHYRLRPIPREPRPDLGWRMLGWALAGTALLWRR